MRADPREIPEPDADARAHQARVLAAVRDAIAAADGALPFDEYQQLALYAPGLGYYAAGARKFGRAGDFVTAPELTPLFGRALARQIAEVLAAGGDTVLEVGPGSGALAATLLAELAALDALPTRYLLLETSPELHARQRARIAALGPALAARVAWLDALPAQPLRGVVLGNELLDALPCERFEVRAGVVQELAVVRRGSELALEARPARPRVEAAVRALEAARGAPFPDGYRHELRTRLPALVATLARTLERGLLLFIDYGAGRRELYSDARATGTFRVHHRQRALDDALFRPGLCDLTAWVDFTAVAEAALDAGLELAGYTTQAHFLLACGISELLPAGVGAVEAARASRDLQLLTLPDEMGERFKAIGLERGLGSPLRGFAGRDLAHLL